MRKITIWISVTLTIVALVIAYELNGSEGGNSGHHAGTPAPSESMPAGHHPDTSAPSGSPESHHN
jgi:hypothetical protein